MITATAADTTPRNLFFLKESHDDLPVREIRIGLIGFNGFLRHPLEGFLFPVGLCLLISQPPWEQYRGTIDQEQALGHTPELSHICVRGAD